MGSDSDGKIQEKYAGNPLETHILHLVFPSRGQPTLVQHHTAECLPIFVPSAMSRYDRYKPRPLFYWMNAQRS